MAGLGWEPNAGARAAWGAICLPIVQGAASARHALAMRSAVCRRSRCTGRSAMPGSPMRACRAPCGASRDSRRAASGANGARHRAWVPVAVRAGMRGSANAWSPGHCPRVCRTRARHGVPGQSAAADARRSRPTGSPARARRAAAASPPPPSSPGRAADAPALRGDADRSPRAHR